jgi:hypothetical protein
MSAILLLVERLTDVDKPCCAPIAYRHSGLLKPELLRTDEHALVSLSIDRVVDRNRVPFVLKLDRGPRVIGPLLIRHTR